MEVVAVKEVAEVGDGRVSFKEWEVHDRVVVMKDLEEVWSMWWAWKSAIKARGGGAMRCGGGVVATPHGTRVAQ